MRRCERRRESGGHIHALGNDGAKVNPKILIWARESAGLSIEAAATAVDLKSAHGKTASERLTEMETGEIEPSHNVLLRMSKAYHRSLLVFYLDEPPRIADRGQDFRSAPGKLPGVFSPELDALVRDIERRQSIVRSLREDTDSDVLPFVGSSNMAVTTAAALATRIGNHIGFSLEEFQRQKTAETAFSYIRNCVESSGVFVILLGNLGSYHTNISSDVFRGFAISDSIAPMIVINDQDAKTAWSFTVVHELAHLWLGTTGLSGTGYEIDIEKYCNDVAGEMLLPAMLLAPLANVANVAFADGVRAISAFAEEHNLSRPMVAYRLFRAGIVKHRLWVELKDQFYADWLASRQKQLEVQKQHDGGPNYYVVKRQRIGPSVIGLITRCLAEGIVNYSKAGQVLGVKPRNVGPLLYPIANTR